MKKKIMALVLMCTMVMSIMAGCGTAKSSSTSEGTGKTWTADNVEGALKGVKLSFGTTGLFGPFSYYDSDGKTLVGYDIEIEKAFQDLLGFEMSGSTQVMDYSALTTSLAEGKVDIGMAALCATDERKAVMSFSKTYCDSGQVVMINTSTSPSEITSVDDLAKGKYKVAVEKGTASHLYVTNHNFPDSCLEIHDTITTAYESLEQGKVDAVIQDGPGAQFYIKTTSGTKLKIVGSEFNQGQAPYAVAISNSAVKANPDIVNIFNAAIDKLEADGTLAKLLSGETYTAK